MVGHNKWCFWDIRRVTSRHFSVEDKVRAALECLRSKDSMNGDVAMKASPRAAITPGRGSSWRLVSSRSLTIRRVLPVAVRSVTLLRKPVI